MTPIENVKKTIEHLIEINDKTIGVIGSADWNNVLGIQNDTLKKVLKIIDINTKVNNE